MGLDTDGFGTIASNSYIYTPSSLGGADDAVNIAGMLLDVAGKRPLSLLPNQSGNAFAIKTPIVVPSKSILNMHPGTLLGSSMANTGAGGFANAVLFNTLSNPGTTLALSVDAAVGSTSVVTATNPASHGIFQGSVISITFTNGGNQQQMATVLAITGTGPYTLLLDEEIVYSYFTVSAGAFIYSLTSPTNIRVYGNGARIFGTGDRAVEFAWSRYVHIEGLIVDPTLNTGADGFRNIVMSFDIACRDCEFVENKVHGGTDILSGQLAQAGFATESGNRNSIVRCVAEGFTSLSASYGFLTPDARNCVLHGNWARRCVIGLHVGANDVHGPDGARGIKVTDFTSVNCSTTSIVVDKASRVSIRGWNSVADAAMFQSMTVGSKTVVSGFEATVPSTGFWTAWAGLIGDLTITDGVFDMTCVSGQKMLCDMGSAGTGTLIIDRIKTIAGSYGIYNEDGSPNRIIRGNSVDCSSVSITPFRRGSTGKYNHGTFTLNGTSNVVVGNVACTAQDLPLWACVSGTPSGTIKLVSIGADTFTVVATAADSATYKFWIVPGGI